MKRRRRMGPVARWFASFGISILLSLAAYFLAVYSYSVAYWGAADSDDKGWLIILFPMLLLPPGLAWLKIALPAAAGLAFQHPAARAGGIFLALLLGAATDVRGTYEIPLIGTLDPFLFKLTVWATAAIGAAIALKVFKSEDRKFGEV